MAAGIEIERQFLLALPAARILADAQAAGTHLYSCLIEQSYMPETGIWTIRARRTVIQNADRDEAFEQTRKRRLQGIARHESPTKLDREGYESMLVDCGPTLRKMRHVVLHDRLEWEIDVFLNPALLGTEVVEVELSSEDQAVSMPEWVGEEVTHRPFETSFKNVRLATLLPDEPRG